MSRGVKAQIAGKVLDVGWEPSESGKSIQNYAVVKVRLGLHPGLGEDSMERAKEALKQFRERLLGKEVVIYASP